MSLTGRTLKTGIALIATLAMLTGPALSSGTQETARADGHGAEPRSSLGIPVKSRHICKSGFDIQTHRLTPEDESAVDNSPAASVEMTKPCKGPVLVRFSSGVLAPGEQAFLYVVLIAECIGSGGFATHCTPGERHFGTPGGAGYELAAGPVPGTPVRATQWIYPELKRGQWKFAVHPARRGGDASLHGRGLSVAAFNG